MVSASPVDADSRAGGTRGLPRRLSKRFRNSTRRFMRAPDAEDTPAEQEPAPERRRTSFNRVRSKKKGAPRSYTHNDLDVLAPSGAEDALDDLGIEVVHVEEEVPIELPQRTHRYPKPNRVAEEVEPTQSTARPKKQSFLQRLRSSGPTSLASGLSTATAPQAAVESEDVAATRTPRRTDPRPLPRGRSFLLPNKSLTRRESKSRKDGALSPRSIAQHTTGTPGSSSGDSAQPAPAIRTSNRLLGFLPGQGRLRLHDLYATDVSDLLGSGTFAEVYSGIDRATLEPVAIKTIDVVLGDREVRKAIECEKKIFKVNLDHPNIVRTHNIFVTMRNTHIVLDLMSGSLEEVMKLERRLNEERTRIVMFHLLKAMHYLRQKNVVHRDIKPDNMLFVRDETGAVCFKLSDFGLAEILTLRKNGRMAATGTYGTPFFASPEVINDEEYDCAADMWSAGVMMYFLLSGLQPFDGPNPREVMRRARTGIVDFPERYWADRGISPDAVKLIKSMLRVRPSRRPTPEEAMHHKWFGSLCDDTSLKESFRSRSPLI